MGRASRALTPTRSGSGYARARYASSQSGALWDAQFRSEACQVSSAQQCPMVRLPIRLQAVPAGGLYVAHLLV